MPSPQDRQEILFFEAAEGRAGVLRQIAEDPAVLPLLARCALELCHLYPDTLVMAGFLRANSILTRWLRSANKRMFRWLDAMVIIGRDMGPKLLAYPKVSPSKISLIPNWATMTVRYRDLSPENSYRRLCGGRFVVAMSGNAGFTTSTSGTLPVNEMAAKSLIGS